MRRAPALAFLVASLLMQALPGSAVEPDPRVPTPPKLVQRGLVIGAAGDISCDEPPRGEDDPDACQHDLTADLIASEGLRRVLPLGDNQYEHGEYRDYVRYFDPTWGRAFARLRPVPGNHEYLPGSLWPAGYFRYFGDRVKGPDGRGYYSYDLGSCPNDPCWHLIALNSQLCFASGGCGVPADPEDPRKGERMNQWLEADLARNADHACTLAYWHHPRFSTGGDGTSAVAPLWDLLYAAHADVVLSGHTHNYQRWFRMDPSGALDPERGIRQFVVGTGGKSLHRLREPDRPALAAAQDDAFGILRLRLKPAGYAWGWISAAGQPAFDDTGRSKCV
jgi:hypothetical protein